MKKVLVLGGTGAMGVYLKDELVALGFEVFVTTRKPRENYGMVKYLTGNAHEDQFLRSAIARVKPDAIIDFMSYGSDEFMSRADWLMSASSHYIFLSSYRVFNDSNPIVEDSPRLLDSIDDPEYLKTDEYALAKAREENCICASGRSNWTIVRPSITYSKMRFQFGCLEANVVCCRALRGQPVIIPSEMLDKPTTMTWGGDAAKMIARLVLNERAFGEAFNVVTAEHCTWREVAEVYAHHIGMKVKEVTLQEYCRICNSRQVLYDRMFTRVMDNSKVLEVTGLRQSDFKPLADGLGGELSAHAEDLQHLSPNVYLNGMIDALCGIVCLPSGGLRTKLTYLRGRFPILDQVIRFIKR